MVDIETGELARMHEKILKLLKENADLRDKLNKHTRNEWMSIRGWIEPHLPSERLYAFALLMFLLITLTARYCILEGFGIISGIFIGDTFFWMVIAILLCVRMRVVIG